MENKHTFVPPYRVGKNQGRVILDSLGHEVGIFSTGHEDEAQKYCDFLNNNNNPIELEFKDDESMIDESVIHCSARDFSTNLIALRKMWEYPEFKEYKKKFDESFSKINPSDFVAKMIAIGYVFVDIPKSEELTIEDYKEVIKDHKKLVRKLDVILNGKFRASEQASLCDIVSQIESDYLFHPEKWHEFVVWLAKDEYGWRFHEHDKVWKREGWRNKTTEQLFKYFHQY